MEVKKNPNVDLNKDRAVYRALGFAFVLGMTLMMFSFTFFDKVKKKVKIEAVSADAETVVNTQHEVAPPPPPPPQNLIQVVENTEEQTDFADTEPDDEPIPDPVPVAPQGPSAPPDVEDNNIYDADLEEKVGFEGGDDALSEFLSENLEYPEGPKTYGIQGVVMVTFTVEKNGTISNITTDGKNDKELEAEAKRVVKLTNGKWIPGKFKKKSVRSICRIPITFEINEDDY